MKHLLRLLLILVAAFGIFCVVTVKLDLFYEQRYVFSEFINGFLIDLDMPEPVTDIETVNVEISQPLTDVRVTFDESLALINTEYTASGYYSVGEYSDSGVYMNTCIMEAYRSLSDAVYEKFGEKLYVMSAYRSAEEQQEEIEEQGNAAQSAGASEHQAGLALDVYVKFYAGTAFLKSEAGRWVNDNCEEYGFIIRYPYYGLDITGIDYEPRHIRYVGLPHSKIIADNLMTLEEYETWFSDGEMYKYGEYIIIHASSETVDIPAEFTSAVVSEDNMGGWWLTFCVR